MCLMSLSILTQLLRFTISVKSRKTELRATRRGEQTTITNATANPQAKRCSKSPWNTKQLQRNGWEQTRLSFLSCLSSCMKHRKRYPEELR
ncbi:uncharacterized protein BKA55DRAFT_560088 [Fusarium redolens]|uniref:Secreted protein n=1 Tax=Fusarium redolens TaxID=48865 RepID=A0A9P9KL07_FUSRE|nr:uncharacterized protein BKA55DRAFT_560088 [Fusarium redolens]KAH7260996.1 hypothetical protein BKA55DRAFT_560088 [Fusarium redolens]